MGLPAPFKLVIGTSMEIHSFGFDNTIASTRRLWTTPNAARAFSSKIQIQEQTEKSNKNKQKNRKRERIKQQIKELHVSDQAKVEKVARLLLNQL